MSLSRPLSFSLSRPLCLATSLYMYVNLPLPPSRPAPLSLSLSLHLSLALYLSLLPSPSPSPSLPSVPRSREECVAGQQTGAALSHTRRKTATAVQLRTRKTQTSRWNPVTLTREFTQNQRHEARNAPSPAFHWHLFCATAVQPTARGSPPRSSRVHPYARSRHDSQRHALNLCG